MAAPSPNPSTAPKNTTFPSPPLDATPDEVRTYILALFTTFHSVSEPLAIEIASKWKFGRGYEPKNYDMATFKEIFGPEAGVVLFAHAKGHSRGNNNTAGGDDFTVRPDTAKPQKDFSGCNQAVSFGSLLI